MRIARSVLAFVLAAMIVIAFTPVMGQVNAASKKKTIHVVKSFTVTKNDGKTVKFKLSYNDDGTLKKVKGAGITRTFKYGDNGEILSYTEKIKKGSKDRRTYTWKDGKMVEMKGNMDGDVQFLNEYTYKGNKVDKRHAETKWVDADTKEPGSEVVDYQYFYKNNKPVKCVGDDGSKYTYTYDKKGNLKHWVMSQKNDKGRVITSSNIKFKISYDGKRVSKIKSTSKEKIHTNKGVINDKSTVTTKYTYKTMKVKKSKVKAAKVRVQQFVVINGGVIQGIPW